MLKLLDIRGVQGGDINVRQRKRKKADRITGSVFEYIIKNYKSKGVPNRIDVDTPFLLV